MSEFLNWQALFKKKTKANRSPIMFFKRKVLVKAIIDLGEREDRILTIIKGKYGLKNKSDAINLVLRKFEQELNEEGFKLDDTNKLSTRRKKK